MTTLREGHPEFEFPAAWEVVKFDACGFYVRRFQSVCGGAKAVDFLAVDDERSLWMIEVKDYRVDPRPLPLDLPLDVARKVRARWLAWLRPRRMPTRPTNAIGPGVPWPARP